MVRPQLQTSSQFCTNFPQLAHWNQHYELQPDGIQAIRQHLCVHLGFERQKQGTVDFSNPGDNCYVADTISHNGIYVLQSVEEICRV